MVDFLRLQDGEAAVEQNTRRYLLMVLDDTAGVGNETSKLLRSNAAGDLKITLDGETVPVTVAALPLPSGAATEATLASLEGKDFATQTTLAALLTELGQKTEPADTQIVDGSGVTQPVSAASLPLPTGASTEATLQAIEDDLENVISTNNSTTTPLGGGATFTGTADDVSQFRSVTVQLYSDKASATDGMRFEFSTNGTNWDDSYAFTKAVSETRRFQFPVCARYFRVRYTNGGAAQTAFRLQTIFHKGNVLTSIHRIESDTSPDRSATLVKAVLMAQTASGPGGGTFKNITANSAGVLKVGGDVGIETGAEIQITDGTDTLEVFKQNDAVGTTPAGLLMMGENAAGNAFPLQIGATNALATYIASNLPTGNNRIGDVRVRGVSDTVIDDRTKSGELGLVVAPVTQPFENVVVDDCTSTSSTAVIAAPGAGKHIEIHYIKGLNRAAAENMLTIQWSGSTGTDRWGVTASSGYSDADPFGNNPLKVPTNEGVNFKSIGGPPSANEFFIVIGYNIVDD